MSESKELSPSPRSSAAIISGNDDLLTEFLLFLPAMSLIRFQLVSKVWQSIISSSSFRRLHTLRLQRSCYPNPQPSFILRPKNTSDYLVCNPIAKTLAPFRFGPLHSQYPHIRLLQTCNGLLLLECKDDDYYGKRCYLVFNPTTMQSRNLNLDKRFHQLCLVFDPRKSPYYRVVCILSPAGYHPSLSTLAYDSETHKWKDIETESKLKREEVSRAIYWNDGIFFTKSHQGARYFYREDGTVQRVYNLSPIRWMGSHTYDIVESNGHLYFLWLYLWRTKGRKLLFVYELSEDDFSWSNAFELSFNPIPASLDGKFRVSVLGLIREARKDDSMLLFHVPGMIMLYYIAAKTYETVADVSTESYFVEDKLQFELKDAHQLVHTLSAV